MCEERTRRSHKTLPVLQGVSGIFHLSSPDQSGVRTQLSKSRKLKEKKEIKPTKETEHIMKKIVSVFATALLLSVAGIASASADTKSDYQAARATYKAAIVTYKTAVTNAHTAIESARATFKSARDAATTKEAKAAAKATFESAKTAAKAGIPTKPVKPVKPAQP